MDLWIRSQDKKCLTMVNHLYIDDSHHIRQQDDLILGTYETKRALEVLEEIQNILMPKPINFSELTEQEKKFAISIMQVEPNCIEKTNTYVYEMPKE